MADLQLKMHVTRLAPSPTGALHLGNARTFFINWLLARQGGWKVVLRIEDLDGPRIKMNADRELMEDLCWLGLDWDEGPIFQSSRGKLYSRAVAKLLGEGAAYPCICSRREVEAAASAPHAEDGSAVYPGTCRGRFRSVDQAAAQSGRAPAIRFKVPDSAITYIDNHCGLQQFDPARELGDFVICKADDVAAYQLAVVVDDAAMGVTDVVRGDDLLDSTPRQILLYRALGLAQRVPRYWHVPLIVGPDGRRLAKRHGDTRIAAYRTRGVSPQRLRQLLARWCGMTEACDSTAAMIREFRIDCLPRAPIVFGGKDDALNV